MESYRILAHELAKSLDLEQPAVAVCFSDAPPDGVAFHEGQVPAGCRFWQDATQRAFTTSSSDHALCAIGVHTHNLAPTAEQQKDLGDALKVFAELGYVRPEDVAEIPVLKSRPKYVTYAPLGETPLPPDLVLLFVRASQVLILSEATQQIESAHPPAMGRPACAVVPQAINSGRAALSLGCCGARAYLDCFSEDKALFAIPGAKLDAYVERVRALAHANTALTRFHELRRSQIANGLRPSVEDSLAAFARQQS